MAETETSSHASPTLFSRTYIGLLAAQFLAAFNDQAIHAAGMFFAINTQTLGESQAISLMPILFYAPWAIFCTLAGYYADRFSKRNTLVFWKVAEVLIAIIATFGFWLGTDGGNPSIGSWIVLSTVFLMGTHSAFFVPAKYGVMPEILQPHLLSKGNGLLESLSFLAVILGTVSGGVLSFIFLSREVNIGIVLTTLAIIGALASLLIKKMPAANPNMKFPPYLYSTLFKNIRALISSRPLSFAVIGIAFFTFIVAFMRATVYMFGESQNPRWDELKTSIVVGTVALGVGLGSPMAGWLSGKKVELGLIPIGALGMMIGCCAAAFFLNFIPGFVCCTILIGMCTGFYLVPLFTLLQYRAPKTSKGDMVSTSNFINVTGAIAASLLFAILVTVAKKVDFVEKIQPKDAIATGTLDEKVLLRGRPAYIRINEQEFGSKPTEAQQKLDVIEHLFGEKPKEAPPEIEIAKDVRDGDQVNVSFYEVNGVKHYVVRRDGSPWVDHFDAHRLPQFLFIGASILTFFVLLLLWFRVRDLPKRTKALLTQVLGERFSFEGTHCIPGDGPVLLLLTLTKGKQIAAIRNSVDRYTMIISNQQSNATDLAKALSVISRGDVVAIIKGAAIEADLKINRPDLIEILVTSNGHTIHFERLKS